MRFIVLFKLGGHVAQYVEFVHDLQLKSHFTHNYRESPVSKYPIRQLQNREVLLNSLNLIIEHDEHYVALIHVEQL